MHNPIRVVEATAALPVAMQAAYADRGNQFLVFQLRGETYGAAISRIREIIEHVPPTMVPMMPPWIRGVINIRGRVVPVIDLQVRFGRGPSEVQRRSCIVVIEVGEGDEGQVLGVLVDAVSAVVDIAEGDIEPAPAFGARLRSEFVRGMGKVGGKFVVLLEMSRVLSIEELGVLGQAGALPEALVGSSGAPEDRI